MRIVIQRVLNASVTVAEEKTAEIDQGLLVFLGIEHTDNEKDIEYLSQKLIGLRIFDDENGVMNKSIADVEGQVLIVSQFTLCARTRKGNRPFYVDAAKPEVAIPLYEEFCKTIEKRLNKPVKTGKFGADMKVMLLNDGPVTIWMDSKNPI